MRNALSTLDRLWEVTTNSFNLVSFNVDIKESVSGIVLTADLPGVSPENLDVSMENGLLTISMTRNTENLSDGEYYLRKERVNSATRSFRISNEFDPTSVSAELKNGVLTVTINKQAKNLPTKIVVKSC